MFDTVYGYTCFWELIVPVVAYSWMSKQVENLRPEPYLPAHSSCTWWDKSEKSGYRPQLVHKLLCAIVFYADAKHHVSLCKVQFWWEVIHMLERVRDLAFFALSKDDELTQKQTARVINSLPHQPDSPRWLIWTIMHKEAGRKAQSCWWVELSMLLYAFRRIMWEANESAESSGSKDMISSSSYLA